MPKKPNYRFDRMDRERQKANKKAERLASKQERAAEKRGRKDTGEDPAPAPEPDE